MAERTFTDEELKHLATSRLSLAKEAIRAGDEKKAEEMVDAIYGEGMVVHDLYRDWLTDVFSEIGRQFGDEKLCEIMFKTVANFMAPMDFGSGLRAFVEDTAAIWRSHYSDFDLREDDAKITFVLKPCGSGGRQIRDGRYKPPLDLLRVEKAQPMTGGTKGCPVYCTHCFAMTENMIARGLPFVITVETEDNKDNPNCLFHIYKDPSLVPTTVLQSLGR